MNQPRFSVRHTFHGVGQGLFCAGTFVDASLSAGAQALNWVHDCGSDKAGTGALNREVDRWRTCHDPNAPLDLLILSHFDQDHIAGLKRLLPGLAIRWVIMPYLALEERMLLAAQATGADVALYHRFLFDPTAGLRELVGESGRIGHVVYVGGSDGPTDRVPDFELRGPGNSPEFDGAAMPMEFDDDLVEFIEPFDADIGVGPSALSRIDSGTSLRCGGVWEFVFHNKPPRKRVDLAELHRDVAREIERHASGDLGLDECVNHIRHIFRASEHFGNSPTGRNEISLVTYAGPTLESKNYVNSNPMLQAHAIVPAHETLDWDRISMQSRPDAKTCALLYTGDITFNDHLWRELTSGPLRDRWPYIAMLQAPHHGADNAWRINSRQRWPHRISLFSYGAKNPFGHPGKGTLAALATHGPVLVNEYQSLATVMSFDHLPLVRSRVKRVIDE